MSKKMKNIAQSEVLALREQISYQEGQIVSKTLTQNQAVSITLFSFAKGEEISTHESGGDAFVTLSLIHISIQPHVFCLPAADKKKRNLPAASR